MITATEEIIEVCKQTFPNLNWVVIGGGKSQKFITISALIGKFGNITIDIKSTEISGTITIGHHGLSSIQSPYQLKTAQEVLQYLRSEWDELVVLMAR